MSSPATAAEKGYILEVDIDYLQQLHDAHNAYLLVPERLKVDKAWMSDYQQGLQHKMYGRGVEKLVPNLRDKTNYVLHYQNLQLYLQLGMRLKKNHRALRFDQSPWMESYMRKNTMLRKQARSTFDQDLYKLLKISVFQKMMENLRKRVNVKLFRPTEGEKPRKWVAKPIFNCSSIFGAG